MKLQLLLSLFLLLNLLQLGWSQTDARPNIIFILTDDQRFDAIGYVGNDLAHTPEMDQLAEEGTYFKQAMVTTPICAASRASILTGLYERAHNFNFRTGNVKEEYMTNAYPKLLKAAGYRTGFYGKYGVRYDDLNQQFDEYESYDRNNAYKDRRGYYYKILGKDTVHLTRYTGQQALDFIDRSDTQQAFCLSLSFSAPHAHDGAEDQYFWQETTADHLKNIDVPAPEKGEDQYFNAQPKFVREGFNRTRWHWRYDTPEKYQHSVKGYYRMIAGIDLELGKIRKKLAEKGLNKNTVIILMGDNGYFLGERQLAGKWLMYDNSVRVPLIVYDPSAKQHLDSEEMALNVDIPATILDLAKVKQPAAWHGKSLLPIVRGQQKTLARDTVLIEHLWEFEHIPPSEGVRTQDWKYFRYLNDKSVEELYDLRTDPTETNNLALHPKHRSTLLGLRTACDRLIKQKSNKYRNPPTGLTVEFIRSPEEEVEVLDLQPEYAWWVANESVAQLAYQILVASSKENINNNVGDVWDSGRVQSNQSFDITHEGKSLTIGETYYWKVRTWDLDNRLMNYSDYQYFTVGSSNKMMTTANKFLKETIAPKSIQKVGDAYLLDFGKAAFASMEFDYTSKDDRTLTIHVGEKLKDGKVDRNPGGHIRYQELKVDVKKGTHTYQLPVQVDKRNTLANKAVQLPKDFPVLLPFRYAEIHNTKEKPSTNSFRQLAFFNYWENDQSHFKSDNDILNQVWDLCKYSIKATTFAGLYVDGDRERIPYEADAYLNQLSHYTTDQEYAIARRTIEYFMEYPTWPTEWQLHVALMVHADYLYTGNTELIEKYYEPLKHKSLMELRNEDGLVTSTKVTPEFMKKLGFKNADDKLRDIVDWPPANWQGNPAVIGERDNFDFQPYNTVINALYYKNMLIMAAFAELLGKGEEAAEFELLALQAKKAMNEQLLDKERGIYVDGIGTDHAALHANIFPLAFDMVPKKYIPSVVAHIKSRKMACSVYGAQYLMDALYNAGEEDYAFQLLADTSDRTWYNMIRVGSTITLEAWDMKYKPNADWNHAWGAVPANVIPRRMWGIQPITPGGSIVSIAPQLSILATSEIEVPFLTGKVKAQYEKINNRLARYEIELPANVLGELTLKVEENQTLTLDGKSVSLAFGTIRLTSGKHVIELKVNSF